MLKWLRSLLPTNHDKTVQDNNLHQESIIELNNVFNTSDKVAYSYVSRMISIQDQITGEQIQISLEEKIENELKRKKILILHGYTKQGKTVLVKNIYAEKEHIYNGLKI